MKTADFIVTGVDTDNFVVGHNCSTMLTPGTAFTVLGVAKLDQAASHNSVATFDEVAAISLVIEEVFFFGQVVAVLEPNWGAALRVEGSGVETITLALERVSEGEFLCLRAILTEPAPSGQ